MYARTPQRRGRLGDGNWQRYEEQVTEILGNGRYRIKLRPLSGLGGSVQATPLVATGASVGTSLATASAIGAWAGPVGAAAGAIVGIIGALWSAHNARAKGAKTENQFLNSAVTAFDGSLQAIFQQANAGQITPAEAISALQSILPAFWASVAQVQNLPGTADASNHGANCGSYVPGQTTPCTPTGAPACNKSCTASCCVGCHDFFPTIQYAIYIFQQPKGGSFNVCTVYGDSYGLNTRGQYSLTYTPPPAGSASAAAVSTASALGIPVWALALGGAAALYFATR
jgi:hypothetical protein